MSYQSICYIVNLAESRSCIRLFMSVDEEESANDPFLICQNDLRSINLVPNIEMESTKLSPDVLTSYCCGNKL